MLIKYFGGADNFFADGIWGSATSVPHITNASTSTEWFVGATDAGLNATFFGFGLQLFPGNIPIGGTITGFNIDQGATRIAEFSGMTWGADPLFSAFGAAPTDQGPLTAIMNTDPITIDARSSTTGLRDFQDHFSFTADLTIKGSAFRDILVGGSGNDKVNGNKGNDVFRTGSGDDIANGGRGHDVFHNDEGADTFIGGAGVDTLIDDSTVWARNLGYVSVNMTTGTHSFQALPAQNDTFNDIENYTFRGREDVSVFGSGIANTIRTGRGSDFVKGLKGHDLIFGGAGGDVLVGGAGNDRIIGGNGADSIRGGTGSDFISAGQGNDLLSGGSGADVFDFNDVAWEHTNTISDYQDGTDLIRVTNNSGYAAIQISATNGGADTLIVLSGGTEIILQNVDSALIDASDFLLV